MIFGGYILRLTFELAHSCAARFSHSRPRFISLDSTTFDCPVPVGSILESEAMVVYTSPSTRYTPPVPHFPPTPGPSRIPCSMLPYPISLSVVVLPHIFVRCCFTPYLCPLL